jgi:hypothetical protein
MRLENEAHVLGGAAAASSGLLTPRAVTTPGAAPTCFIRHRSVEHWG